MGSKSRNNFYAAQDKYLIGEQPGMAVLVSGLLIAIFLGLITRAFIAPSRVRNLIEKAAQSLNKDVSVQFDSAEVSLSDGILPRFAVVITNVRMESERECWMKPTLEIDQMRLPISLLGLISGRGAAREIQTDNVKLSLHGDYKNCLGEEENRAQAKSPSTDPVKRVSLQQATVAKDKYANLIREVSIGKLQIESDKYPMYHGEFQDINFRVKSFEPQWLVLNAKTHLFRDEQVGDYLAHANIHVEYKQSPEPNVEAHFFGNWREGHYSLVGNYSLADKNLILETELKHIPFSQILALLQKYHLADPTLNARQLWLSFNSHYSGDAAQIGQAPMEITNLQLDGDQIEMGADKITLKSLNPLRYDPIRLNVEKLNIDKVLSFFNRGLSTKIFSHMGSFSGLAEINSGKDVRLRGVYSGLEFIFANRGQREVQSIDRMQAEASYLDEAWKIHLSQIQPNQGVFKGDIQVAANKTFADMDVKLKVDEAVLAPHVQKLMTQGGEIGPVSTQLALQMRAGRLAGIKGLIKADRIKIEGAELTSSKAKLDFAQNEVLMNVQVAALAMEPQSTAMKTVSDVFQSSAQGQTLRINNINGQFRTQEFRTLLWKNFSGQMGPNSKVSTEGAWNEKAQLSGNVLIKNKKNLQRWKIGGTRSRPEFTPATESRPR